MSAKGSMNPEFIEVRIVGTDPSAASRTVSVNGRERADGLGRPLFVQPGIHKVSVSGYQSKKVKIRGGDTDEVAPRVVDFVYPDEALSSQ